MQQVLSIVAPIFALIALGYCAGRFQWIAPAASKGLADFTFTLAIPAMLFRAMATADLPDAAFIGVWGAFFGAALVTWLLAVLATAAFLRRSSADGASIAMSSGFGNVVMLGIPLAVSLYGEAAAAPSAIIISLHTPLLLLIASSHLAIAKAGRGSTLWTLVRGTVSELSRNMIVVAIVAGTAWRLTGMEMHPIPLKLVSFLAQAAIPCALVALGLSLVNFQIKGQAATLFTVLILKLAIMPAVAWLLAVEVFALPPIAAGVVILFAAMPTGANAFLFADRHGHAANSASGAVALGTVLAAVTASAVVYILSSAV
jgi:malonate transporter and related proteins